MIHMTDPLSYCNLSMLVINYLLCNGEILYIIMMLHVNLGAYVTPSVETRNFMSIATQLFIFQ